MRSTSKAHVDTYVVVAPGGEARGPIAAEPGTLSLHEWPLRVRRGKGGHPGTAQPAGHLSAARGEGRRFGRLDNGLFRKWSAGSSGESRVMGSCR